MEVNPHENVKIVNETLKQMKFSVKFEWLRELEYMQKNIKVLYLFSVRMEKCENHFNCR